MVQLVPSDDRSRAADPALHTEVRRDHHCGLRRVPHRPRGRDDERPAHQRRDRRHARPRRLAAEHALALDRQPLRKLRRAGPAGARPVAAEGRTAPLGPPRPSGRAIAPRSCASTPVGRSDFQRSCRRSRGDGSRPTDGTQTRHGSPAQRPRRWRGPLAGDRNRAEDLKRARAAPRSAATAAALAPTWQRRGRRVAGALARPAASSSVSARMASTRPSSTPPARTSSRATKRARTLPSSPRRTAAPAPPTTCPTPCTRSCSA